MTGLHLLKGSDLCVPVAFCHYKQNQLVGLDSSMCYYRKKINRKISVESTVVDFVM